MLTRETSITFEKSNGHHHHPTEVSHVQTSFSLSELVSNLSGKDAVVCCFEGSDLLLTSSIIDGAVKAGIKLFVPSEYGLDSSNSGIRELLPPYQTRFEALQKLQQSGMKWKAVYSGILLEDAINPDGVLGVDALWASVVVFPGSEKTPIPISTYQDIAKTITHLVANEDQDRTLYCCAFKVTLDELVEVTEREIEKPLDRYEGSFGDAKREARERMKLVFFDGGVALMGKVAVWDSNLKGWAGWRTITGSRQKDWQSNVATVVRKVRSGDAGGAGCGC